MPLNLQTFKGEHPKVAPELLPNPGATIAEDVKLYSGELIPYFDTNIVSTVDDDSDEVSEIKTIIALNNPNGELEWVHWFSDVDVVLGYYDLSDQYFFFTGDGVPKLSNYSLFTGSNRTSYELGITPPDTALVVVSTQANSAVSSHVSRDSGNIATLYFSVAHGFRTGNVVTVSIPVVDGIDKDGANNSEDDAIEKAVKDAKSPVEDLVEFAASNVRVTVTSDTELIYFSPGEEFSKSATSTASSVRYNYGSTPEPGSGRPGEPGSTPSTPSTPVPGVVFVDHITEGKVTLSGNTNLTNYVYTYVTSRGEESVPSPISNNVFIKNGQPVTMDLTDVLSEIRANADPLTLNIYRILTTDSDSEYYLLDTVSAGDSSMFTDDYDTLELSKILPSSDYDKPPPNLEGLTQAHNNILVGFVGNTVYFSEPDLPHAWPEKYKLNVNDEVVAIGILPSLILVLTKKGTYRITGNSPDTLKISRLSSFYPCLSKRSVLLIQNSVVWATHVGLVAYNISSGITVITLSVHSSDTWNRDYDVKTITACLHDDMYYASHSRGAFMVSFEGEETNFVTVGVSFSASYTDVNNYNTYLVISAHNRLNFSIRNIVQWDNPNNASVAFNWKSKVFVIPKPLNYGIARIVGGFVAPIADVAMKQQANYDSITANRLLIREGVKLGQINTQRLNVSQINSIEGFENIYPISRRAYVVFVLYQGVNSTLVYSETILQDSNIRLPHGYKTDRYQIELIGTARIKNVYVAETPRGLGKI